MPLSLFNGTSLTSAFQFVHSSSNNVFGLGIVLALIVIGTGATIRWGESKALLFGMSMGSFGGIILFIVGILSIEVVVTLILVYVLLVFAVWFFSS